MNIKNLPCHPVKKFQKMQIYCYCFSESAFSTIRVNVNETTKENTTVRII